jgi:di/tricarboxylate transporter
LTTDNILVLVILGGAVILFVTERLRVDLVALLVLASLALTGLVTPAQALSGFSSAAVVTVWAMFILSGGLTQSGVAGLIGQQILRLPGRGEIQLMAIIMLTAGVMSAFMNNVGVAALLLPVVIHIARQTKTPPSRLLLPLAIGSLLGGMTTLIGTPPNILTSEALAAFGLEPFGFFDFLPVGIAIMLAGILFMVLVGRRLLPDRHPVQSLTTTANGEIDTRELYGLEDRLALITIPAGSPLANRTLAESRIGRALGLTILGLQREGRVRMSIQPDTILHDNDRLLALGHLERLVDLSTRPSLVVEDVGVAADHLLSKDVGLAELEVTPGSSIIGQSIAQLDVRRRYSLNVLAIRRDGQPRRSNLQELPLLEGDVLLLQGARNDLARFGENAEFGDMRDFTPSADPAESVYRLQERLLIAHVPEDSTLVGRSLLESRLGDTFGLVALGIIRPDHTELVPTSDTELVAGDMILLEGNPEDLPLVRALQKLQITRQLDMDRVELESATVGLTEAVLSPHTTMVNKTLRGVHFREKYGLSVLAIWRDGQALRSNLGAIPLEFGDAFLIYGPHDKINMLGEEPDFVVLQDEAQPMPRLNKAPIAALIMIAVVVAALAGWAPIAIAAVAGAALMVLSGSLTMEEAYHFIDWRAVFLIACMLPLGIALEQTGTAQLLAEGMVNMVGDFGPYALLAGVFVLTSVASQFMPNAVVTVLMAPIALNTARDLALSPYALMMVVAIAASAAFMSPVGHPANVLVMGPGGYRFKDFIKVGLPLTIVVLIVTMLVLPIFWPLTP